MSGAVLPSCAALAMTQEPPNLNRADLRDAARARLDERRARARRIQRRVIGVTVALFLLFWAVSGVQLASGHDPALTRDARLQAARAAELAAQSAAANADPGPYDGPGAPGAPGASTPTTPPPTPVLTRPS